jgi:hypothetical protein
MTSLAKYDEKVDIELLGIVEGYSISEKAEFDAAGELLLLVKRRYKEFEALRVSMVKPLNDQVSGVNAQFRPGLNRLGTIEARLKGMMGQYTLAQREEQQRLLQAAAEASRARTAGDLALALRQQANEVVTPQKDGVTITKVWDWELLDAAPVPREYLSVDPTKLNAAVKAGVREIPGVRIFETSKVVVRVK